MDTIALRFHVNNVLIHIRCSFMQKNKLSRSATNASASTSERRKASHSEAGPSSVQFTRCINFVIEDSLFNYKKSVHEWREEATIVTSIGSSSRANWSARLEQLAARVHRTCSRPVGYQSLAAIGMTVDGEDNEMELLRIAHEVLISTGIAHCSSSLSFCGTRDVRF